jgi:hypothetical protein
VGYLSDYDLQGSDVGTTILEELLTLVVLFLASSPVLTALFLCYCAYVVLSM